jgi:hypothetical protein
MTFSQTMTVFIDASSARTFNTGIRSSGSKWAPDASSQKASSNTLTASMSSFATAPARICI